MGIFKTEKSDLGFVVGRQNRLEKRTHTGLVWKCGRFNYRTTTV